MFEKHQKTCFLWIRCVFECWFKSLWVCYRYGWWCVGNLGSDPFQTQHDWIFIQRYRPLGNCQNKNKILKIWFSRFFLNFIWSKYGFFEYFIFMRFFEAKQSLLYVSWEYGWTCVWKGIIEDFRRQKNLIAVMARTFWLDRTFDWFEGKFQKLTFSIFDILLPWDHFGSRSSPLDVCYRYGWWCVGNLGPDPFQTQHD